jgi:hypothetical protein
VTAFRVVDIVHVCEGHALGEADSCSCIALQQSPEPKLLYDTWPAGRPEVDRHLQDAVTCPPSTAAVTTELALVHDTGEAALRVRHTVLCLCVSAYWVSVRLGKRLWDVRSSGVLRSAGW